MQRLSIPKCSRWRISHAPPQVCNVPCLPRSAPPWSLSREAHTALLPSDVRARLARSPVISSDIPRRKSSEVAWLALACAEEGPTRLVQLGGKRSSSLWRGTCCPNLSDGIGTEATGIQWERMCAKTTAAQNSDIIVTVDASSLCDRFLIQGSCSRCAAMVSAFSRRRKHTWRATFRPANTACPSGRAPVAPNLPKHFSKSCFLTRVVRMDPEVTQLTSCKSILRWCDFSKRVLGADQEDFTGVCCPILTRRVLASRSHGCDALQCWRTI